MMQDEYQTIAGIATSELFVKKSRFYGLASCVRSSSEFADLMQYARETYPGASHYCYAYTIGHGREREERSSDGGEPTHSAGPPILSAVQASGLTNIACIVVRYFGGIKLGIGGLIRAYGRCARECLAQATIHTEVFTDELTLVAPYDALGAILQRVERMQGKLLGIEYAQTVTIRIELRLGAIPTFLGELKGIHPTIEATVSSGKTPSKS